MELDTKGWSQEKINMIHAMTAKILFDKGKSMAVKVVDGKITSASKTALPVITAKEISDAYDIWKKEADAFHAQDLLAEKQEVSE